MHRAIGRFVRLIGLFVLGACVAEANADVQDKKNNLVYHVFVRSFADSNGDGIGDLKGITDHLDDYLNDGKPDTDHDLEVGILWLMPIFPTESYHGYDVIDYRSINPDYGTMVDLQDLIAAAHDRNVRIILDLPINHTSRMHPWFTSAVADPESESREYFHFRPNDAGHQTNPWHLAGSGANAIRYKGLFSSYMPDLNFYHPPVRNAVKDVATFWLEKGIDGFRLDAAKHIYGDTFGQLDENDILKNNDWWREFSQHIYKKQPQAVLVGEILDHHEMLRRHAWALDGLVDEPMMNTMRNHVAWPQDSLLTDWKNFIERSQQLNRSAFDSSLMIPDQDFQPFVYLASHDKSPRLASHFEAAKEQGMKPSVDSAYRVGMYLLAMTGRYPILYNGDEVLQKGWKWNGNPPHHNESPGDGSNVFDETLREPFPWYKAGAGPGQTTWFASKYDKKDDGISREEQDGEGGILHLIRGMTNLRTKHVALANGAIGAVLTDTREWLVFERRQEGDRYVVLINTTENGNNYRFHEGWFPSYRQAQLVFWSDGKERKWLDETENNKHIEDSVYVAPYGMVVLKQRP